MTKPPSSMGESAGAGGIAASGTKKAGSSPNTRRAIEVAVAVATTTGRKVRFDTSGSSSSTANITPPSGVLNVAAMPAPAPADEQRDLLPAGERQLAGERRAERGADLDDRPLAADRGARADRDRRGDRLDDRDDAAHVPLVVIDGVHDLRHAVALGLRREGLAPATPRSGRRRSAPGSRTAPTDWSGRSGWRRRSSLKVPRKKSVVDHRDHGAEDDRAERGDDADEEGEDDQGGQADGRAIRPEIRPFRPARRRPGLWCRS